MHTCTIGHLLMQTFHDLLMKMFSLQIILFPESHSYAFTQNDREVHENCRRLRNFMLKIVEERKK